jgi:hypothetical protein
VLICYGKDKMAQKLTDYPAIAVIPKLIIQLPQCPIQPMEMQ